MNGFGGNSYFIFKPELGQFIRTPEGMGVVTEVGEGISICFDGVISIQSKTKFNTGDFVYWNERDLQLTNKKFRYKNKRRIKNTLAGIALKPSDEDGYIFLKLMIV